MDHLADLRGFFKILRKHKMNPLKCFLAVVRGKLLVLVITESQLTQPKRKPSLLEMKPPTNLRELKRLQGHLAYIRKKIHLKPIR
jgi:hypothetical protein